MSRIRSVHPGLFTDEDFVICSDAAQIFYVGLLTEADDQGLFEWKPVTLKMRLRPASMEPVEPLLEELRAANRIASYEMNGRKYGAIRNFKKYQRPKKPNSIHPMPEEFRTYVEPARSSTEPEPDEPEQVPPKSEIAPQMEEGGDKGRGRKKEDAAPGGSAPVDLKALVFDEGRAWLAKATGKADGSLRSLLGKWCRDHGDGNVIDALAAAQREAPVEPVAWITAKLSGKRTNGRPVQSAVTPFGVGG